MKKYNYLLIGLISLFVLSCVNEEGEGGISVVQGKVFKVMHLSDDYPEIIVNTDTIKNDTIDRIVKDTIFTINKDTLIFEHYIANVLNGTIVTINRDTVLSMKTDTFPAAKEDVYIVYGDEPIYGDKMETGYDGFYRFKYLTKGTYKVFAYSALVNSQKRAVIDTVTVADGETKNVQNIYIHEGKSYEASYIKGTVNVKYYNKGSWYPQTVYAGYDVRVYIRLKGAAYHFDEARTGLGGTFVFQNLKPGTYEVFVFSEVVSTEVLDPVIKEVTIDNAGIIKSINTPFLININV